MASFGRAEKACSSLQASGLCLRSKAAQLTVPCFCSDACLAMRQHQDAAHRCLFLHIKHTCEHLKEGNWYRTQRVACLEHEALDDSVEDDAIVVAVLGMR